MTEPTGADLVVRRIGRLTTWAAPVATDAAVVIRAGRIAWTGAERDLPRGLPDAPELDAAGAAVVPGFVDCHTHAVWAGDRRADFEARLRGAHYSAGGIATTVAATRAASEDDLRRLAQARVDAAVSHGTTTIEVKSGYGLSAHDEMRLLDVAASLSGPRVVTTYLGAHVVPPDTDRAGYVDEVVAAIPAARSRGAQWCDVFCDDGAFTVDEARTILRAAATAGLGLRIHAEQLAHTGGARLAAEVGCASADHLDHADADDARALAAAGVVAVLVPVACLYARAPRWPDARMLVDAGCTVAVATDCNPGTAWCESMPYAVQVACLAFGLSIEEGLRAASLGGAAALRRSDLGHLDIGACGDLAVLATDHEIDLVAHLGANAVSRTVVAGRTIG